MRLILGSSLGLSIMVFSSPIFIFGFFPVFFLLYFITPSKYKNLTALSGSIVYYFWGAPMFVFVIAASLVLDWTLGNGIYKNPRKGTRKLFLTSAIISNVGMLAYFKYSNFFVENAFHAMDSLGMHHGTWATVALPIGISFVVFEKITYLVDIYRRESAPAQKLEHYFLYIFLFPHLVAGPIIQYHDLAPKLLYRVHDYAGFKQGMFRFSKGLIKKVWIADLVATAADSVFAFPPSQMSLSTAWLGIIAYSLQIYFDFSGYADMAIGMMRLMGFTIPENFDTPYISQSITEFWRRWHMSLGRWMKAYLYIPLGGNRVSLFHSYINLVIVFTISGIWHGANWTFLIWGIYHGCFLVLDRLAWLKISKKIPSWICIIATFVTVSLGWVLFRSPTLSYAVGFYSTMFDLHRIAVFHPEAALIIRPQIWFAFFVGILVVLYPLYKIWLIKSFEHLASRMNGFSYEYATLIFLLLALSRVAVSQFSPFIYFRF